MSFENSLPRPEVCRIVPFEVFGIGSVVSTIDGGNVFEAGRAVELNFTFGRFVNMKVVRRYDTRATVPRRIMYAHTTPHEQVSRFPIDEPHRAICFNTRVNFIAGKNYKYNEL